MKTLPISAKHVWEGLCNDQQASLLHIGHKLQRNR